MRWTVVLLGLAACAMPVSSTPPMRAPHAPLNVELAAAAPRPHAPWGLAYTRECHGGTMGFPAIAPDASSFSFCSARFETRSGAFRGLDPSLTIALLDDERTVSNFATLAILRGSLMLERAPDGAYAKDAVVSVDRTRLLTLESVESKSKAGQWESLVVRSIPSLDVEARATVVSAGEKSLRPLGFLRDGRAVVLASHPCRIEPLGPSTWKTPCDGRGIFVVERDRLVSLGVAFVDVDDAAVNAAGDRLAIVRRDGPREVLSPDGTLVAKVPAHSRTENAPTSIALDATGERVAWLDASGVSVAALEGNPVTPVILMQDTPMERDMTLASQSGLAFGADGSLLVWGLSDVAVFREGAKERDWKALADLKLAVPPGFEAVPLDGGQERERRSLLAQFHRKFERPRRKKRGKHAGHSEVDVAMFARDPSEFDARDLETWAAMVRSAELARFGKLPDDASNLRYWESDAGRSVEIAVRVLGGCDPYDRYARFTERDGVLYEIAIDVWPQGAKDIPFDLVFDAPFREPKPKDRAHFVLTTPAGDDSPC